MAVRIGRSRTGTYQRQADIWANPTDPDATLMHKKGGGTAMGYHTHYAVDGGKARIILTALVTPSEVMDNQPMLDLLWHSRFRWALPLEQVTGDTKYGTVENIVAIEDAGLRAYIPLTDFDKRSPLFGKQQFTYDVGTGSSTFVRVGQCCLCCTPMYYRAADSVPGRRGRRVTRAR